jgi:hypothetical protein
MCLWPVIAAPADGSPLQRTPWAAAETIVLVSLSDLSLWPCSTFLRGQKHTRMGHTLLGPAVWGMVQHCDVCQVQRSHVGVMLSCKTPEWTFSAISPPLSLRHFHSQHTFIHEFWLVDEELNDSSLVLFGWILPLDCCHLCDTVPICLDVSTMFHSENPHAIYGTRY